MRLLALAVAVTTLATTLLWSQPVNPPAAQVVINDSSWSSAATGLEINRARSFAGTARLTNVSVRARAGTGADTLIAGAALQGPGSVPLLVRAVGPGLARFGVSGALREPRLEIYRGTVLAAQTNTTGPGVAAASAYVGAFPPLESPPGWAGGDAALLGQASGGTLTAHCSAAGGAAGVALLEFYDASAAPAETAPRFVNLSARARVEEGEALLVAGFVIAGEGRVTLLLRGVGPGLAQLGLTGFLRDPVIELHAGGERLATNDNWRDHAATDLARLEEAQRTVGAFALAGTGDAALLVSLPAGTYTLQVRGNAASTGLALAEIHEVSRGAFDAAGAVNGVGLDLYRQLAAVQPTQNLVVSPYSIESALALAYAGADGATRTEMARVLRLPAEDAALQVGFAGLRTALDQVAADSRRLAEARTKAGTPTDPLEWSAANRLFSQSGYTFREPFLALMRDGFAAPFEAMDFRSNPEPPRRAINAWVEEQTRRRIVDLIPAGGIAEETRLVLVNALHLKAPWETPFEKSATVPRPFRSPTGAVRDVSTLQRTGQMGYAREEGCTVVTLDYLGSGLHFVIVLPDEGVAVEALAARLGTGHFTRWSGLRETSRREVALSLPKFQVRGSTVKLGTALRALGIRQAFDEPRGSANFERIAPRRPDEYLAMAEVYHQTFIALDEGGTEAAAATAMVIVGVTSVPPPPIEVRVDRPFLFLIQHRASGACLFLGRVTNPS
ncbi:MAG: serpin family protein [Verrucomicrobia bacterium]|nr:serpin family protein [Verrucomicrobiota bacterium]